MEGKFRPLGDRVLVKPNSKSEMKTKGGIIIADSAQRGQKVYGEVVSVGTGIFSQSGGRIPMTVKVGDKVMYGKYSGTEFKLDDEEHLIIDQNDILAIIK